MSDEMIVPRTNPRFLRTVVSLGPNLRVTIDELKMRLGSEANDGRFTPMSGIEVVAIIDVLLSRIEALEAALASPAPAEPHTQEKK